MPLKHALPLLSTWLKMPEAEALYNAKFVGEFPIKRHADTSGCLFYQETPPNPEYSNYFLLFYCPFRDTPFITSGKEIAERVYSGTITPNGDFIYSRNRHDYITHDGCMVDGGDSYFKSNGKGTFVRFEIQKDKLEIHADEAIPADDKEEG